MEPCPVMSPAPNLDSFQPPKEKAPRGPGPPPLPPTTPAEARPATWRAAPPCSVKTDAAFPYGEAFSIASAWSRSGVRTIASTGPEDLLSGNSHVWAYPIQNGGTNPEAAFSSRDAGVAPVQQQGGPRGDSLIHGSANPLAALTGNYRTEISARHQRPGLLNQALDDVICPGYR